jgi:TM2 domain-containing membrane protein YozV
MSAEQKKKEPVLTAILNLFTGGGGYIYIGQMTKGIVFIAAAILTGILVCLLAGGMAAIGFGLTPVGALACIPLPVWGIIALLAAWDGFSLTQRVNEGRTLGNWDFFFTKK